VITFVDISERKRAEEALHQAADELRALQKALPAGAANPEPESAPGKRGRIP